MPRHSTRQARKPMAARPAPLACTFICTACGAVQHMPSPTLPEGWVSTAIGHDVFAYCPDDAIDVPARSAIQ